MMNRLGRNLTGAILLYKAVQREGHIPESHRCLPALRLSSAT